MSSPDSAQDTSTPTFPLAEATVRQSFLVWILTGSRMWWLTLLSLVIAIVLVWQSVEERGPEIRIRFPEGHGLKVGDFVRHRGIDVGHVDRIHLSSDLQYVDVTVTLLQGAEGLAREGSQFWIERPQVSLTQVRGLDTALGGKYVGVRPGNPEDSACYEFQGMASAPTGELDERGVEVVLRGERSYGLQVGAPLTWRGVEVGEVLSVTLAADTRYVDVRAQVDIAHRHLLRENSRFWVTSGLGIEAGLTGFSVQAPSLTTIARGGISFITPADSDAKSVGPGHVFRLHSEEDKSWTEQAGTISLLDQEPPKTVGIHVQWKRSFLGFTRSSEARYQGLLLETKAGNQVAVLAPDSALQVPEDALPDSFRWTLKLPGTDEILYEGQELAAAERRDSGLSRMLLPANQRLLQEANPDSRLAPLPEVEDCCLVRTVHGTDGASSLVYPLSKMELQEGTQGWRVETKIPSVEDWQGAAVVTAESEKIIGLFLISPDGPAVVAVADPK